MEYGWSGRGAQPSPPGDLDLRRRDPFPYELDQPSAKQDRTFHRLPVRREEFLHLEQLQLRQQRRQRVVQRVLQPLLSLGRRHLCSGATGRVSRIPLKMVRSALNARAAVAAAVKDYRSEADIPSLLSRLDAICAETPSPADLVAAVEPFREMHEVAGPVYERVVEREPENAAALVALANAYWLTGRGPDVVGQIASRALAADPSNRAAWHLWALTESSPRARMTRWHQVTMRFPDDKLAHAALADNATSVASAENDSVALKLAVGTYEMLLATAGSSDEKSALASALGTIKKWSF